MYPLVAKDIPELADKQWLEEQFKTRSVRQVARQLNIPHTTLRGYIDRYGIDLISLRNGSRPGLSQPGHPGPRKKVITKEDILREYINKDVSMTEAARALGCSIRPFFLAMKEHGIEGRPRGVQARPYCGIEQLADAAWLARELETKTITQIARELRTSHKNVSQHVKQYGLVANNAARGLAVKEGLRISFPEGRRGSAASNWQGGRRKTSGGHVYLYAPDHPYATKTGYVMEHRLVAEKKLGRLIDPKEHVHHINGDKKDNRPENLEVMTHAEHTKAHFDAVKDVERLKQQLTRYAALYGPLPAP